jgi:HEAT repeat protein
MRVPRVRFTIRRLMIAVAVLGVLLWAWLYRVENASLERSFAAIQLRAFAEGNGARRRLAIENLAHSEPDDLARVLPTLAAGLHDDDRRVRLAAAKAIDVVGRRRVGHGADGGEIEPGLRVLITAFGDERPEVRVEAMRALGELAAAVTTTSRIAGRRPPGATFAATVRRAADQLLRQMKDADPAVRAAAVRAFCRVGSAAGADPDPIVAIMFDDPDREVRDAAAGAVAGGWPTRPELYRPLLKRLKEVRSLEERSTIGWALGNLPAPPLELIPDLLEALALDLFALNRTVPEALAKLGPAARPALPALARAAARELADPSLSALVAAQAIAAIDRDSPEAQALLEPIVAMLRTSRDSFVRQQAAVVLKQYGPSAAPAVPSLRMALKSDVADVRERAAFLLGTIGPAARPALDDLRDLARRAPDSDPGRTAAEAARRIDTE